MSQLNRIGRLILATISGDNAEATRLKIVNKGISAFTSQIAVKEATTLDLKEKIEDAKGAVDLALINNGKLIGEREEYLSKYIQATNDLKAAEHALKIHLEGIKKLKEGLAILQEN